MTSTLLSLLTLVALATPASAEPYDATEPPVASRGYLAVSSVGGIDQYFRLGLSVEGGYRIADSRVFVRGQASMGASAGWLERGTYQQVRGGVEAKQCAGQPEALCAFAGADLGFTRDALSDVEGAMPMHAVEHDLAFIPRVGGEVGQRIRVRAAVELPMYRLTADSRHEVGVGVTAGVGYTF